MIKVLKEKDVENKNEDIKFINGWNPSSSVLKNLLSFYYS